MFFIWPKITATIEFPFKKGLDFVGDPEDNAWSYKILS